ncbi:MAG: alpha/beta hydrolase [Thermoplasmata archaeon]
MSAQTVTVDGMGTVDLTFTDVGEGRPILLLHGGAGPQSMAGFAQMLTTRHPVHVYAPTLPGFNGTPRPDWLTNPRQVAKALARLLDELNLMDITIIGNSIGGWIAAELALTGTRRMRNVVLVDAGGIVVEGHPTADVFSLPPSELAKRSFHNPAAFPLNLATMSDQQKATMAANRATLVVYSGGPGMDDTSLRERLHQIRVPVLVVWGDSDQVVDPEYGRAYARSIPGATFHLVPNAGHMPQIEAPDLLLRAIGEFMESEVTAAPSGPAGG